MPEEVVKASLVLDLTTESQENIEKQTAESITKGVEKAASKGFNFKNISKDMLKGISDATGTTTRVQEKSINAAKAYALQQDKISNLINMQGSGFAKAKAIVGETGKLGLMGIKGMVANINPYVAAVKVAAEAAKFMADQFQRIAKESSKFVGQGSIFADKETMSMMQRTGQTATQAQATQRSLGSLGLNFEDIQQGKITQEQAALFEELRNRELKKLEEINAVAGPMFKSMQQVTLGITLLLQDINDWITIAMASAPGIENMIGTIKAFLSRAGGFLKSAIDTFLGPIFSVIGDIVRIVMDVIMAVMDSIQPLFSFISPILKTVALLVNIVGKILSPLIRLAGMFMGAFNFILKLFSPLSLLVGLLNMLNPLLEMLAKGMGVIGEFASTLIAGPLNFVNGMIKQLKDFEVFGFKPFSSLDTLDVGAITSGITNSTATYQNQTTNNYIYGSQSMNQANPRQNNNDLFANSYVLVND